ncbi:hypothetical protein LTR64_002375 [Lithohypha guttulata]|uniref:uncharacterized protein n=1 Tax=Lithohypha guttulata TaxID=1690604 RepID=UPI00315C74BE
MELQSLPSSLQGALHSATRSLHAQLNKTIMTRFPLCLPPHATDPMAYHLGMLVFSQIFKQFERSIDLVLAEFAQSRTSLLKDDCRARHIRVVKRQYTKELLRSQNTQHDQEFLSRRLKRTESTNELLGQLEEKLNTQAESHAGYIGSHIQEKPYLALAYTWTMYLALFNGGRYLQKLLAAAGPKFWRESSRFDSTNQSSECEVTTAYSALSFWHFDEATEDDPQAEQLKQKFKRNFDEASLLLTAAEIEEVVQEARSVFELCLRLIQMLDEAMLEMEQIQNQPEDTVAYARPLQSGVLEKLWQGLSRSIVGPACDFAGWHWTISAGSEVKVAE